MSKSTYPTSDKSGINRRLLKATLLLLTLFGASFHAHAQNGMLRGFVTDASDAEPLQGVNVILTAADGSFQGASTDFEGL